MRIAIKIGKFCLLLLIGISIAILWIYCQGFLPHEFYGVKAINPEAERLGGMITLATLFAAPAVPLYRLYAMRVVMASVIVGWIPLALSVTLANQTNLTVVGSRSLALSAVEGVLCWLAIVIGAWTVKTIFKPTL